MSALPLSVRRGDPASDHTLLSIPEHVQTLHRLLCTSSLHGFDLRKESLVGMQVSLKVGALMERAVGTENPGDDWPSLDGSRKEAFLLLPAHRPPTCTCLLWVFAW